MFASIIAKHTKSNCIILAKDYKLIGSGMGQVSRIDALNQAIEKSKKFGFKSELDSCVMASDAFFHLKIVLNLHTQIKSKILSNLEDQSEIMNLLIFVINTK